MRHWKKTVEYFPEKPIAADDSPQKEQPAPKNIVTDSQEDSVRIRKFYRNRIRNKLLGRRNEDSMKKGSENKTPIQVKEKSAEITEGWWVLVTYRKKKLNIL